jgi:hypothetical protein
MGIDGTIIKRAAEDSKFALKAILSKSMPPCDGLMVYIEDSLTRVLWNPGKQEDWMYSGEDFFCMWLRPFISKLNAGFTDVVSSFDAPNNVPQQKARTQLARNIAMSKAKARKVERGEAPQKTYPEHYKFEDRGIYDPTRPRDETVAKFDLRGVTSGPRTVRQSLWDYVFKKLQWNLPERTHSICPSICLASTQYFLK